MPIIGLNLKLIEANTEEKKTEKNIGSININSSPTILNVEKRDIVIPKINDVLGIDFKFETLYFYKKGEGQPSEKEIRENKFAEISFSGEVLYQTDKSKEILHDWKKDRQLSESVTIEVFNAIFRKCLTKALDIANEFRLPPPLHFPVGKPKETSEYIG